MSEHTVSWCDHAGRVVDSVAEYDIIDCRACGFRHVVPLPDADALDSFYRQQFYAEEKPNYLAHAEADAEWIAVACRDRLASCAAILGPGRRRLLDIGSGPGHFLKTAGELGWAAIGVEPGAQAVGYSRGLGLDVREGFFDDAMADGLGQFDLVHLSFVLEHIPDPAALIGRARRVLAPGGLILVTVPNDYNDLQDALQRGRGYKPWWLVPPHHLNYFDFESLTGFLARQGFEIAERSTGFPMELFLLMGENYVGDDEAGRRCHARRKAFDMAFEEAGLGNVRSRLYKALAAAGFGREAVVIGRAA
ncbi:class I SAM-dependent methyltransferase [Oceanibacterium hippocampi]|uniref:Putative methyltransferase n=1 Tax=Oceanibacterium hippocampi TaxID=745714 RepID=A0A1Y5SDQ2_9PROT|nr:class I SAM-dependent methyltransferase [Oceanibacterium hippocampi]SLN38346.1 putative methyltransferase [Oceanibacterium hippocampi]